MNEFTEELDHMIESESESVKTVLKLLFSSLAVVFQETEVCSSKEEPYFAYSRIASIPAAAARMLWSELLGDVSSKEIGDREFQMIILSPDNADKAISQPCLEEFKMFVNAPGEISVKTTRRKSNDNGRGILPRNWLKNLMKEESKDIVNVSKQHHSNDPFMAFVRDTLVAMGFIELDGWTMDSNGDIIESEEEEGEDIFVSAKFSGSDFSGWDRGKQLNTLQCFRIDQDQQFQYGIHLSGIMNNSSAVPLDAILDTTSLNQRKTDTMKRWNDAMSNACRKQLAKSNILENEHNQKQSTNANANDTDNHSESKAYNGIDQGKNSSHATNYVIQMYPSHLMRAGRLTEAGRALMNPNFLLARLVTLEAFETVSRHKRNLDELTLRSRLASERRIGMGSDSNSLMRVSQDIFMDSFNILSKCIQEQYPIASYKKSIFVQGESNNGELGRALHLIAAYLDEKATTNDASINTSESEYSLAAVKVYKLSLDYKIAALGNDHSSVGRTYRYLGHKYLKLRQNQKAIDAYSESIRISWAQDKINYKHLVVTLNSIGMIYSMTGQLKMSIDNYYESLAIQKVRFSETDLQVAETLNSIGIVHGMMGDYGLALKIYTESLSIMIHQRGKDHEDVADIYLNRGLVLRKKGDYELAIQDLQQALRIRKNRFGDQDEEVARTLHHINVVLEEMEKDKKLPQLTELSNPTRKKECSNNGKKEVDIVIQTSKENNQKTELNTVIETSEERNEEKEIHAVVQKPEESDQNERINAVIQKIEERQRKKREETNANKKKQINITSIQTSEESSTEN